MRNALLLQALVAVVIKVDCCDDNVKPQVEPLPSSQDHVVMARNLLPPEMKPKPDEPKLANIFKEPGCLN